MDNIGLGIQNLASGVWNKFARPLDDIWASIKSIPDKVKDKFDLFINDTIDNMITIKDKIISLPEEIWNMFVSLFVTEEGYIEGNVAALKEEMMNKFGINTTDIDMLKNVETKNLTGLAEFEVEIFGQRVKIIDFTWFDSVKSRIHNIARGFFYPLILVANLDHIYFLIRGSHLFGKSRED